MISAIIFDAEGVVIDTEPVWDVAQANVLAVRHVAYNPGRVKRLLTGRSLDEGSAVLKQYYQLADSVATISSERLQAFLTACSDHVGFIAGFRQFYDAIRGEYALALATAMDPSLFARIDGVLGLTALFGGHVSTLPDVGYKAKPNPDLFLHAATSLGCDVGSCLVIEDSPLGVQAAHSAGMRVVGLTTTYDPVTLCQADFIASSFAEIEAQLSRLTRRPRIRTGAVVAPCSHRRGSTGCRSSAKST